jgi:hypothetical protein
MARPEVKAKRAEQMKQYNQQYMARPEVKAKRAEQMNQYNQQYKDAAEQAETSKLGPFGADPFGLTFGADPPVALPPIGKEDRKEALEEFRKGKGKSGGARGEGASDKRAVALEARERLGLPPAQGWKKYDTTYWEQEGCCLAHRLASRLAMPCPRHHQAGREAGPHQYLSKPFHCGCCVGTCELCDPSLSAAS